MKMTMVFVTFSFILNLFTSNIVGIHYGNEQQPEAINDATEWIAYIGADNNVWIIHPDGSENTQITKDGSQFNKYVDLKWSPNGKYLSFISINLQSGASLTTETFFIHSYQDATTQKIIEGRIWGFDWSPDSEKIVFGIPIDNQTIDMSNLWLYTLATGNFVEMVDYLEDTGLQYPEWSPDGMFILARHYQHYSGSPVAIVDLTDNSVMISDFLGWCTLSSDGKRIICEEPSFEGCEINPLGWQVYGNQAPCRWLGFSTPDSLEYTRIPGSNTGGAYGDLLWAPDDSSIAICKREGQTGTISMLDPNTLTQKIIASGLAVLDWSPDGKRLLISRDLTDLSIFDINTEEIIQIGNLSGMRKAKWQPKVRISEIQQISDLQSRPGTNKGEVKLTWTSPAIELAHLATGELFYDIRISETNITEVNWDSLTQFKRVLIQKSGLEQLVVKNMPLNTKVYYAIRVIDEDGNPVSLISNTPSLIDTGLRPKTDGYSFRNGPDQDRPDTTGWGRVNLSDESTYDFTFEDARETFGDEIACIGSTFSGCNRNPFLMLWMLWVSDMMNGGHCAGMSSTISDFYYHPEVINNTKPNVKSIYTDVEINDVRRLISKQQALQKALPTLPYTLKQENISTASKTLDQINDAFINQDPIIIGLVQKYPQILLMGDLPKKHAVTPFALMDLGNGKYQVWVYDSSEANGLNIINVDPANDRWEYSDWSGEKSHSFYTVPVSLITGKQVLILPSIFLAFKLGKHVGILYADEYGNKFGYDKMGDFINEIPGAYQTVPFSNFYNAQYQIYSLPNDREYSIYFSNTSVTDDQPIDYVQFGKNFYFLVSDTTLAQGFVDEVTISKNRDEITYKTDSSKKINLSFSLQQQDLAYVFNIQNMDVYSGKPISFSAYLETEQFIIRGDQAGTGSYDLNVTRVNSEGEKTYIFTEINIEEGDTHQFLLAEKNIKLLIDQNSDGTIDKEVKLRNETKSSFTKWWLIIPIITSLSMLLIFIFSTNKNRKNRSV